MDNDWTPEEPIEDMIARLRKPAYERLRGGAYTTVDTRDLRRLLHEVAWLRALPVLASCGDCGSYRVMQDGRAECARTREHLGLADEAAPVPPEWCPLRKETP